MIGLVSTTSAGATARDRLAAAWPARTRVHDGQGIGADIERAFAECDGLVCFLASDATAGLIAALLAGQAEATGAAGVVCVDEAQQHAVALPGGHAGGANALARAVADAFPGCRPVTTTATDAAGVPGLDTLGWPVEGAVPAVTRAVLDGEPVALRATVRWPLPVFPPNVTERNTWTGAPHTLWVTDQVIPLGPAEAVLRPPSLTVGVGASRGVSGAEVLELIQLTLDDAGLSPRCVAELATVDAKAGEPGLLAAADRLGVPLRTYDAGTLSSVTVPNPSDAPRAAVGTPSVAEAAALAAGGGAGVISEPGGGPGELIVPKTTSAPPDGSPAMATAALARRRPRGLHPNDDSHHRGHQHRGHHHWPGGHAHAR